MQIQVVDFSKKLIHYNFSDCTKEELENKMNLFFTAQGYKIKKSTPDTVTYEKGNRLLRILFGAFTKYHKQTVTLQQDGDHFAVSLHRDSSGMSGGVIGMNQVKKEFSRLSEEFKAYFK
ncbi:MAG: hypothetical protein R2796_09390 [Chitinophagaceae bacterium]|nr:hypothetical protein [Chitinophagaceae bacterium]MCB0739909.1 hypothetical protein [Chitinophagaceae bacterium]